MARNQGFTLVELAIVMIIIGLLLGGVLKGQELISNSQITATVKQVAEINTSAVAFLDTYGRLPGNLLNADTRLPGCVAATNCAVNGASAGDGLITVNPGAAVAAAGEGARFFQQLVAADLLTGSNAVPQTSAVVNVGDEVPAGKINGTVFRVGAVTTAAPIGSQGGLAATWQRGNYLTLAGDPTIILTNAAAAGLRPVHALALDVKIDDGLPQQGLVRAGGQATCVVDEGGGNFGYQGSVTGTVCALYLKMPY